MSCKLSNGTTSNFTTDRSKRYRQYSQSKPPYRYHDVPWNSAWLTTCFLPLAYRRCFPLSITAQPHPSLLTVLTWHLPLSIEIRALRGSLVALFLSRRRCCSFWKAGEWRWLIWRTNQMGRGNVRHSEVSQYARIRENCMTERLYPGSCGSM